MPRYAWRYGPNWGYYHSEAEVDRDKVHDAAKALLSKATKGDAWTDPHGTKHIPVLADGAIVGSLWEDVALSDLELATYWAAPFGVKAELSHSGKVVGSVWIDV